jgi:hypothetical protein
MCQLLYDFAFLGPGVCMMWLSGTYFVWSDSFSLDKCSSIGKRDGPVEHFFE